MKPVKELFHAEAAAPWGTATMAAAATGFCIPEYQRHYDWSANNINRLFYDCLNAFKRLEKSESADIYTFLGTLILVEMKNMEKDFNGTSYGVVDGQQRLTTLFLMACSLHQSLTDVWKNIEGDGSRLQEWLETEIKNTKRQLGDCAVGNLPLSGGRTYPFPRIIRVDDTRGSTAASVKYVSPIAEFLYSFGKYIWEENDVFEIPSMKESRGRKKLVENFEHITSLIHSINNASFYDDTECEMADSVLFGSPGFAALLNDIDKFFNKDEKTSTLNTIAENEEYSSLLRIILFSQYFLNCIVLTRVVTDDESAAFDIFDALNTTGEPLTALETLKPRVIRLEANGSGSYEGTPSETSFNEIQKNLDELYIKTDDKQKATKELLVTFALFLDGTKLSMDLSSQRSYLRTRLDDAAKTSLDHARTMIGSLANITVFRRYYWRKDGIEELSRWHSPKKLQEIQFLMSFILDMKTSLALPILFRYWSPTIKSNAKSEGLFLEVLRAMVAFIVIRRSYTGGTAGIDSDFRNLMGKKSSPSINESNPLNAGVSEHNNLLPINKFRNALLMLLEKSPLKPLSKNSWLNTVSDNPIYTTSKPLVRILLFAAAHHSRPDQKSPGLLTKIRKDSQKSFLTYENWVSSRYATIEHIAPFTKNGKGWEEALYKNERIRQQIGNLIALPLKENSAIGNDRWERKKKFYLALSEDDIDKLEKRLQEAETLGFDFGKNIKGMLRKGERFALLDHIREVDIWTVDIVKSRSLNIATLAYDYFWEFLSPK